METCQFCKNSYISQKSFYALMRWFFIQLEKVIIRGSHGVCKKSYNHSSVYYNLQEIINTWSLSNIRGFPYHYCLDNLHCTCLQCSGAQIRPLKLTGADLVDACLFQPCHASFWNGSLRCSCKDTRLHLLWLNLSKISQISPKSFAMTYRERQKVKF